MAMVTNHMKDKGGMDQCDRAGNHEFFGFKSCSISGPHHGLDESLSWGMGDESGQKG